MFTLLHSIGLLAVCGLLLLAPPDAQARDGHRPGDGKSYECSLWEGTISPAQHEKAEQILAEARPKLTLLRQDMMAKMQELKSLSYNNQTDPEDLARLGQQLQQQRDELLQELRALDKRLRSEVGENVRLRGYHGRGCAALTETSPCPSPQAGLQKQLP